ncbi:polysaccharide biosynthesis protein [Chakrabartia godavariana]|nr:polysaccharide biosynthesis protein [Chakrabartia godavariana]
MFLKLSERVLVLPRYIKRSVALTVDSALCIITVALAFALRLDGWNIPTDNQLFAYFAAIIFAVPLFVSFGLYRAIFRFAGWHALMGVVRACVLYGLVYSFVFTIIGIPEIPRTIGLIQPTLLLVAVGASRAFARALLGNGYRSILGASERKRVLIYGAGSAGRQLAAALANSSEMELIGFVDDDARLHGSVLNGKRIYSGDALAERLEALEIDDLLLAIPSATRQRRSEIVDKLQGAHTTIRTLPGLMDIAHGRVTMQDLRELEIEDLLGREAIPPNKELLSKNIVGKAVMVTGAGGSIGGELCRQILKLKPGVLILVENNEFNLYAVEQDLEHLLADQPSDEKTVIVRALGSVQDAARMESLIGRWKPHTIYHAAAFKHVPIVESNPSEGVLNNVFGTRTMANLAIRHGVRNFVLVSTDKAVRPTNVMGTTKRLAELVLQALAAKEPGTVFAMVRFGNVLGSSGSVVPLFRKQIQMGGPVTLTHKDITRYFMTIPEAALLVIQAGAMAKGGEVFVLEMGEPVRIMDLARRMIELSGLRVRDENCPDGDIEIKCVGLRPGEKLYEELLIGANAEGTSHPRILKARESFIPLDQLEELLEMLRHFAETDQTGRIIDLMRQLVPEAINLRDNSPPPIERAA